ncbi:hypothetical protein Nepgr_015934 [Nepenthes gracilis]|uniref:ZC3H15/TMA46 family C-terminal domain-containing protein n=1 Tax=Nepenthes gracilis TaxID=150966 RepID=A0AAD3SMK8_NEPGR|nr:hypothetical protein Nepgr_015934 [Nepenthes gracilis]
MGAEEEVSDRRARGDPKATSITEAQYALWKRRKDSEASARRDEAARKREEDIRAGTVLMNGRELFIHEPWVFDNTHY